MPLVRSGFIPIPPGTEPGFDHADIYQDSSGASRLYVARTGADRVDVIDRRANRYLRALHGHPGVAGVFIDTASDLLFTSDRATSRMCPYRCSDEELLARVDVGAPPNALAFDPARRHLYSFNLGEPLGQAVTHRWTLLCAPPTIANQTSQHSTGWPARCFDRRSNSARPGNRPKVQVAARRILHRQRAARSGAG